MTLPVLLTDVSLFQFPEETCVDDNDRELSARRLLVITSELLQNFSPTFNFLSLTTLCDLILLVLYIIPVNAAASIATASQIPLKLKVIKDTLETSFLQQADNWNQVTLLVRIFYHRLRGLHM